MPIYDVDIPGMGQYTIESDRELDDAEVMSQLTSQLGSNPDLNPSEPDKPVELPDSTPANQPDASFLDVGGSRFFARTGRRLKRAAHAAGDLPSATKDLITGGTQGRVDATMRLLEGAFSPVSATLAPLEAAVEEASGGLGINESVSRVIGDISGLPLTIGAGLLAQAGKLNTAGLMIAEFLGAGRPKTIQELMKRDPQFRFAATREPPKAASDLERLARKGDVPLHELTREVKQVKLTQRMEQDLLDQGINIQKLRRNPGESVEEAIRNEWSVRHPNQTLPGMEELAVEIKSPATAQAILERRKSASDQWDEFARQNKIVGDTPQEAKMALDAASDVQVPDRQGNFAVLGSLRTPATRAGGNAQASQSMLEMQVVEKSINDAILVRSQRVQSALVGVSDKDMVGAVHLRESTPHAQVMSDVKISTGVKRVLQFMQEKFAVDREIIIPRLRKVAKPRIEKRVRRRMTKMADKWHEDVDEVLVQQETALELKKQIPDNWGLEQYLTHIFPGFYKIRDRRGRVLGTANNKLEAKQVIQDLAEDLDMGAVDFDITSKALFDSDLLRIFKGRVSRTQTNIARGTLLSKEEVSDAIRGDFNTRSKIKFFGPVLERKGKSKGYTKDLMTILETYDRGIERWIQLSDLAERVTPTISELGKRGYINLARTLESNLGALWGFKHPVNQVFDSMIAATPGLRDIVAPGSLQRITSGLKIGAVNTFLRFNPRYHALNSTQLAATLAPIADGAEIGLGIKLWRSAQGKGILKAHQISDRLGKVEGLAKGLGAPERMNQQVAFLTMYGRARRLGLGDQQAATYGLLRGNVYSQFLGLITDQPTAFRKLDPTGMMFMFQRFPVKQAEMLIDLVKDRNFPGVAKFLSVNFLLGGMKAATFGTGGWLTYKVYKDIEKEYGTPVADMFHVGLPGLVGVDMSGSVTLVNPPFGETWQEKLGNLAAGPIISTASSIIGAAMSDNGIEPSAAKRALSAMMQRIPLGKSIDGMMRLLTGDFDFKDPAGRLRWKGDFKDAIRTMLGARPIAQANIDTFVSALLEMTEKRNEVLNFAALRFGQAKLAGMDIPEGMMKTVRAEVDNWNSLWPEFPISGDDIFTRATARQETALMSLRERILKSSPAALREGGMFSDLPRGGG